MTQNELLTHITQYLAEQNGPRSEKEVRLAAAQAIAWIEGLSFWVRERNMLFLPGVVATVSEEADTSTNA